MTEEGANPPRRWTANIEGALWVLLAVFILSIMSALVKLLGQRLDSFQIAFFRSLFGLVVIVPFLLRYGPAGFATRRPGMHILRSVLGVSAMMCGFYAITHLSLADATAITFTKPLFLVLLATPFLGETVGWRRWTATMVGFAGALIMIRPGGAGVEVAALVALVGALLVAIVTVAVKKLSMTEKPITILFYFGVTSTAVSALPAALVWQTPSWIELGLLFVVGALGATAQTCTIRAYHIAEASAITPFDYSRLLFAGVIGSIFFSEIPDQWTVLGAAIIVISSLYIAHRERRRNLARNDRPAVPDLV